MILKVSSNLSHPMILRSYAVFIHCKGKNLPETYRDTSTYMALWFGSVTRIISGKSKGQTKGASSNAKAGRMGRWGVWGGGVVWMLPSSVMVIWWVSACALSSQLLLTPGELCEHPPALQDFALPRKQCPLVQLWAAAFCIHTSSQCHTQKCVCKQKTR